MTTMHNYLKNIFKFFIFLLAVTGVMAGGLLATASANDAMSQLQKSVDEILSILQAAELRKPEKKAERQNLVLDVVNEMFDFRNMARSSLGQSWNSITPEEQDKFVDLFKKLVEQRYIGKIDAFDNQKVVYQKQLVKGDKAMIYTDLIGKDLDVPIIYKLQNNDGKWLIYDMKIENVSLIVNYRSDFESIIRKEQFAGLIDKMTQQLEKKEAEK
jgi:phospholipid transport system substrate-binding protein